MKYFEIIYTSSAKNLHGSKVGFGIRTYSEDFPKEHLDGICNIIAGSFEMGNFSPRLNPRIVMENPNIIASIPPNYIISHYKYDNVVYCIIARQVYIGFDYPYFSNFKSTRLGNYFVHAYVFENEIPQEAISLIGSGDKFIPKSPVPSKENIELLKYMLGEPTYIKHSEILDNSEVCGDVDIKALQILFAYIEAIQEKKKLIVKTKSQDIDKLLPGFLRLLSQEGLNTLRFVSSHQGTDIPNDYDVLFLNEYSPFDTNYTTHIVIDIDNMVDKQKSVNSSFFELANTYFVENKYNDIHLLFDFLITPEYLSFSEFSNEAVKNYYLYETSDHFNLTHLDADTLKLMSFVFKQNVVKQEKLNGLLHEVFKSDCESIDGIIQLINISEKLSSADIDISMIVRQYKKTISQFILSEPLRLLVIIEKVANKMVLEKYIDLDYFKNQPSYFNLTDYNIYRLEYLNWFYDDIENKIDVILNQIEVAEGNINLYDDFLKCYVHEDKQIFDTIVKFILDDLDRIGRFENYIRKCIIENKCSLVDVFPFEKIKFHSLFAPLLKDYLFNKSNFKSLVSLYKEVLLVAEVNNSFKELLDKESHTGNSIYKIYFNDFLKEFVCEKDFGKVLKKNAINDDIFGFVETYIFSFCVEKEPWNNFLNIINGTIEEVTAKNYLQVIDIAHKINAKDYLLSIKTIVKKGYNDNNKYVDYLFDKCMLDESSFVEIISNEQGNLKDDYEKMIYYYLVKKNANYKYVVEFIDHLENIDSHIFLQKYYTKQYKRHAFWGNIKTKLFTKK